MATKNPENACCLWNITLYMSWQDEKGYHQHDTKSVHNVIKDISKHYAFQVEKGTESKLLHYQIAVDLKDKKRRTTLFNILKSKWSNIKLEQITMTSICGMKGRQCFSYCTKEDTRVEGPWTDKQDPTALIKDVQEVIDRPDFKFYPWQEEMFNIMKAPSHRRVVCIVDHGGHCGKTFFKDYCFSRKLAFPSPVSCKMGDATAFILSAGLIDWGCFLFDIPRAIYPLVSKNPEFWCNIEQIKNGMFTDIRYKGQYAQAPRRPCVVLFMNSEPPKSMLTSDMWDLRMIGLDKKLYAYDKEKGKAMAVITEARLALRSKLDSGTPAPSIADMIPLD